jgi:hypothetical protein
MRRCKPCNCQAFEMCEFVGRDGLIKDCKSAPVSNKLVDVPDIICKECDACLGGRRCIAHQESQEWDFKFACDAVRLLPDDVILAEA